MCRQTAWKQLKNEIKKEQKKWWNKDMGREGRDTHGNGVERWRPREREKSHPGTMRYYKLCPTLTKTGLCQAAVRKWASWFRKVAFHHTLPHAFMEREGPGQTWIASLPPLVLKILWSPKIKSAVKVCYQWKKEGWQGSEKQWNDRKNYIITIFD